MLVTSQAKREVITLKPTQKSATASETKSVGFGAEISSAAVEEDYKSISSDGKKRKNPSKNPKPGLHSS